MQQFVGRFVIEREWQALGILGGTPLAPNFKILENMGAQVMTIVGAKLLYSIEEMPGFFREIIGVRIERFGAEIQVSNPA